MLLLNSPRSITIDGVTVFPDHADPDQFWYLPAPVSLQKRTDGRPAFTFIKFKPAAVAGGAKGGGYVMFTACLRLSPKTEQKIMSRLASLANRQPKLAVAQFDQGTVKCVALNLQGEGGTSATAPPPGAFNAVEKILGASTPSMQGDEDAVFSLVLSQEGAIILEQAYRQNAAPIGVIYNLTFTGLRPALNVKITANFKRVYDGLSASLSGQYYFIQATIEAAFEKLKQDGAIKIEVIDFTGAADHSEKEKWALDFFKNDLLAKWFEPTLVPGETAVKLPSGGGLPTPTIPSLPGGSPAPSRPPAAGSGSSGASGGDSGAASVRAGTGTAAATATERPPASPAPARDADPAPAPAPTPSAPPARFEITSRDPNPSPAGYGVTHTPATSGNRETLVITGGDTLPQVKIDSGNFETVAANRTVALDVPPGTTHTVIVRWPNQTRTDTFPLYFSYEKPREAGFTNAQTNPLYKSYLLGTVSDDPIYSRNHRPGVTAATQVQALQAWLQTVQPGTDGRKTVDMDAHASYEGDDLKAEGNSNLSQRRLEVARGVLRRLDAQVSFGNGGIFLGHTEAKTAGRVSPPRDNADGSPNIDRVTNIRGPVAGQNVTITGTIRRDAAPPPASQPPASQPPASRPPASQPPASQPPASRPPGASTPPASTPPGSAPPASQQPGQTAGNPAVAFRLKFVHQEELKTLTFEYNRQDATQRFHNPQNFFDLLLKDLGDADKTFLEVDLDDPFFRILTINASMPIDFGRIGLKSAHVAIDYGNSADPQNHRTGDFVFSPADPSDKKFECFLNKQRELDFRYSVDFNFDPQSPWIAEKFSYHLGPFSTSDRNLFINPYERLGFLEVTLFPHEIDPVVVDSIDVMIVPLKADQTPAGPERVFHVLPDSPEQFYKFRSEDSQVRTYSFQSTTNLKDGTVRRSEPKISGASQLAVNDPFDEALAIELVPLYDVNAVKTVFIDIEYDDDPNQYHRRERVTLEGNAPRSTLRLALMNKAVRNYRFRFTFIGTNNQIQSGAFKDTTETILAVAPGT